MRPQVYGWGALADLVLAELASGPLNVSDIVELTGSKQQVLSGVMKRLVTATDRVPKRAYIQGWEPHFDGRRTIWRAVYALGDKKCKPKPAPRHPNELAAEARARKRARLHSPTSSIFRLGASMEASCHAQL